MESVRRKPELQLNGLPLTIVRIMWLIISLAVLVLLVPEVQATFEAATRVCPTPNCADPQVPPRAARALHEVGLSLQFYAAFSVVLVLFDVAVCYAVAIALMLRRSGDRMVLLTAFACVLQCTPANLSLLAAGGIWSWPSHVILPLSTVVVTLLFYLFPSGTFVPRWTVALAIGFIAFQFFPLPQALEFLTVPLFFGFFISIIALQVHRFRKVSSPVQRQQTKLVVFGIGILVVILVGGTTIWLSDPDIQSHVLLALVIHGLTILAPLAVVGGIGLAVLRYGLWDVDVFINRTLIYLSLTVSLVLVYLGSVLAIQLLFQATIGRNSDLSVVISTLIIAALFNPLRRRIQDLIARTFYRRKYDAVRVLAAFGVTCRDETDLRRLGDNMVRVVEETMHPVDISLWLRDTPVEGA